MAVVTSVAYPAFREHVLQYFEAKSAHAHGKARQVLDALDALDVKTSLDLTKTTAARFVKSRGIASNPNTTRGLLSYFKRICALCEEEQWVERVPRLRGVTPHARKRTRNPAIRSGHATALLDALGREIGAWADHRLYALTYLVLFTGLRYREAVGTLADDYDLAEGIVRIRPNYRALKTSDSYRTVPIPDSAVTVLQAWLTRVGGIWVFPGVKRLGPWDGGSPGYKPLDHLRSRATTAGIPGDRLTWHGLRRTYATTAVRVWGIPIADVSKILGHNSVRTTELYIEDAEPDDLRQRVRGVRYGD
jgi:integrase